jgi:superfamily II DNA or RNA helicase
MGSCPWAPAWSTTAIVPGITDRVAPAKARDRTISGEGLDLVSNSSQLLLAGCRSGYGPAVSSLSETPPFATLKLRGSLRPYQLMALDAFEADRAAGRRSTHLVAPPGSGKTVVGLEIVRRLERPALVLAPTATVAGQWSDKLGLFSDDPAPYLAPRGPLHVLTYQSICQTADPGGALRAVATERLIAERAQATGTPREQVRAEVAAFTGTAREHFGHDVSTEIARLKRAAARGEGPEAVSFEDLLAPRARERVAQLVAAGVGTLVLDECHHLASLWGYLVGAAIDALGDVHTIGLTATTPSDLGGEEAKLYESLLGPVDFQIPTPAVVRDGHLAPYQELAYFTTPLASEREWLAERHSRFAELLDRLHDPTPSGEEDLGFGSWVIGRIRYRDTGDGAARVPFSTLAARRPELARAGLRYLSSAGLELPDDAPRGEGWHEPPTLDDWLVLISDYAVGCLRAHPGDAAERRFTELQIGLRDLGFVLTRQGVRRGGSEVDRVLTASAAKPLGAIEVLAAEAETRGESLRAVILCDSERGERQPEGSPLALSGGARGVLRALGEDIRTAALRPLLVTGSSVACLPGDATRFGEALAATASGVEDGLTLLSAPGWDSRSWVGSAGRALAEGTTQLMISTRGLLGEGWDEPSLNVVVDLTTVAADVSVRQMRGRALRLDPADPDKLASNWDVVCVAADLARGTADYGRFVRRHAHLHAPCEDGSIESGVSHVHAALSPYQPPPDAELPTLNADVVARAGDLLGARSRWQIGQPYIGEDVPVLLVRVAHSPSDGHDPRTSSDLLAAETGAAMSGLLLDASPGPPPKPAGPLVAFRIGRLRGAYPTLLPLDRVARAVVAAYVALGEIGHDAGDSLALTPRDGGLVRCALTAGNSRENALLASALDEAITPASGQRYVVSRPMWPEDRGAGSVIWRALSFRAPLGESWHPVPSDLGGRKERAIAYHEAWQANVGPGQLLFAGREAAAGREELASAASASAGYVTSRRTLWH